METMAGRLHGLFFHSTRGNTYYYDDCSGMCFPCPDELRRTLAAAAETDLESLAAKPEKTYWETFLLNRHAACGAFFGGDVRVPVERPWTQAVKQALDFSRMRMLYLVVTNACNLRCKYCIFSDHYDGPTYNAETMTWETAKAAVDYFLQCLAKKRTRKPDEPFLLTFYGGEPLLNFDLIRRTTEYVRTREHNTVLSLTTNGVLLDEAKAAFLVENNFSIAVSLDGPEAEHDRNRVFPNGRGSFAAVTRNLDLLWRRYPDYEHVIYMATYDVASDLAAVRRYFASDTHFSKGTLFLAKVKDTFTDYYAQFPPDRTLQHVREAKDLRDAALRQTDARDPVVEHGAAAPYFMFLMRKLFGRARGPLIPATGSCIPGEKICVLPNGDFQVCERVPGTRPVGNVRGGLNFDVIAGLIAEYNERITKHCVGCPIPASAPPACSTSGRARNSKSRTPISAPRRSKASAPCWRICIRVWKTTPPSPNKSCTGTTTSCGGCRRSSHRSLGMRSSPAKKYFRLFPDVLLAADKQGDGCLYLLPERRMMELGPRAVRILEASERNRDAAEIAADLRLPEDAVVHFTQSLAAKGTGCFMDAGCFIEKVRTPDPLENVSTFGAPLVLERFRLTLSDRCDERCDLCPNGGPRRSLLPCAGCSKRRSLSDGLSPAQIEKALAEAAYLDCRTLLLAAGSTRHLETLLPEAIQTAQWLGFTAIHLLLGTPASDALLARLGDLTATLTLQVLAPTESEHDARVGRPGAWAELMHNIAVLKEQGRPFELLYAAESKPRMSASEAAAQTAALGARRIIFDRQADAAGGRGYCSAPERHFSAPGVADFVAWVSTESCVHQVLTLNADGRYSYCPLRLDNDIGGVDGVTVAEVMIAHKSREHSGTGLEPADSCRDCKWSLACQVCQAKKW